MGGRSAAIPVFQFCDLPAPKQPLATSDHGYFVFMHTTRNHLIKTLFEEYIEMYSSRYDQLTARFRDNFLLFGDAA
jgi:hypothetical protein